MITYAQAEKRLDVPELNYAYLYNCSSPNLTTRQHNHKRIKSKVIQLFQILNIDEFEEFIRMIYQRELVAIDRNLRYEDDELDIVIGDFINREVDSPKYSRQPIVAKSKVINSKEFLAYRMFLAIRQHMNTGNNYEYISTRNLHLLEIVPKSTTKYITKMQKKNIKERIDIRDTLNNKLIKHCYLNSKESDNKSYYSNDQYIKLVKNIRQKNSSYTIEDYLIANLLKNPEFVIHNPTVDEFRRTHLDYLKTVGLISYKFEQNLRDMRKYAESYFENKNKYFANGE